MTLAAHIARRFAACTALVALASGTATAADLPKSILFGVACYDEHMRVDRVDEDARMEMLTATTATVVARYKHPSWPVAAAMTRNTYGRGEVSYLGFMPTDTLAKKILIDEVKRAGIDDVPAAHWPVIVRGGTLTNGYKIRYLLNYSADPRSAAYAGAARTDLLSGTRVAAGGTVALTPWGVAIVEGGR